MKTVRAFIHDDGHAVGATVPTGSQSCLRIATVHRELKGAGCRVISVSEAIDDSPAGNLMRVIIGAFAEYERSVTTLRTSSGQRLHTNGDALRHIPRYSHRESPKPGSFAAPRKGEAPALSTPLRRQGEWSGCGMGCAGEGKDGTTWKHMLPQVNGVRSRRYREWVDTT